MEYMVCDSDDFEMSSSNNNNNWKIYDSDLVTLIIL